MNHQHKFISIMDYNIFWSSLFAVLVLSHKTNGILTESNDLHCTHIQCPTKCPEDSYLKSTMDMEEDEFIDFKDEFISDFEELTPLVEFHEEHPEHTVKERQKREVFFQDDIESCCGDQKCVCNECPDVPKCFEGYVAVRIHEGNGKPGNCCSQYRCLKKEACQMGVKQTWWTGKCTNCSCFGEMEFCEQICREEEVVQNCYSEYLQKPLINGASWQEGPCTNCNCEQGKRRCFASICPKLNCKRTDTFEDVCCPKCVDDETDERTEVVHNQEVEVEEEGEEANTGTIELSINDELNSTEALENPSTDVIILGDNFTSTPLEESVETNTSTSSQELTSTSANSFEFKIDEQFLGTAASTETSTAIATSTLASSSVEEDVSIKYEHISSTILSSTFSDELHSELDSTTKSLFGSNEDVTTSTTSTKTERLKPENELTEETTTAISSNTEVTASTTISAIPIRADPNEETTTQISLETSSSAEVRTSTDVPTTTTSNITPLENISTGSSSSTTATLESTTASSSSTETSPSTTTENILFSQMSSVLSSNPTQTPVDSTTTDISSSTATTSTTSSPYSSALETSSVNPVKQLHEESSTTSTTSAPEPLMPLYQLYGEFNSDERISSTNTQNQMRIMFNEIDYVVMIALFVGALMCIAVGVIIRHAKNRKKLYSSVPNSETSLSQTSTVMTV